MKFSTPPEVTYAKEMLIRHYYLFGYNFTNGTAVDTAAELLCELLERDEAWEWMIKPLIDTSGYKEWT